ncbi:MAG: lipopolysaccharide biosynthesis protein [Candidatus Brocadiia bacterium]
MATPSEQGTVSRLWRIAGRSLRGLWSTEGSVGQKAVRGAFWTVTNEWISSGLGFVQTVVLVRLLVPADFGIMRIAAFLLALVLTFTKTGMDAAIIQRQDAARKTIDTAWTINLLRSGLLYAVVFFAAPYVARFYDNPIISPILRVVGLKLLFAGFTNIGLALLKKDLDFRVHELFFAATHALGVAVTLVGAFILHSVWAIAIGQVAAAAIRMLGSYVVHAYRPRPVFDWAETKRLLGFGLNLTGSGILIFLSTQGDDALVGKVVGMTWLGYYTLAYGLSILPLKTITRVLSSVSFPAFSKLQGDLRRLTSAFSRVQMVVSALVLPASVGLLLVAPDLVRVVYGQSYMPMVPCFQVLVIYGMVRAIAAANGPVFLATGNPRTALGVQAVRFVVLAATIYPMTVRWGISGAAGATTLSISACTLWSFMRLRGVLGAGVLRRWAGHLGRLVLPLAAMSAVVVFLGEAPVGAAGRLVLKVVSGALVYLVVLAAVFPELRGEARAVLRAAGAAPAPSGKEAGP